MFRQTVLPILLLFFAAACGVGVGPGGYTAPSSSSATIESFAAAPELLAADREARRRGSLGSPEYVAALDDKARRLLTARIARAVEYLGAFWLSAWEQAGRPAPPGGQ